MIEACRRFNSTSCRIPQLFPPIWKWNRSRPRMTHELSRPPSFHLIKLRLSFPFPFARSLMARKEICSSGTHQNSLEKDSYRSFFFHHIAWNAIKLRNLILRRRSFISSSSILSPWKKSAKLFFFSWKQQSREAWIGWGEEHTRRVGERGGGPGNYIFSFHLFFLSYNSKRQG